MSRIFYWMRLHYASTKRDKRPLIGLLLVCGIGITMMACSSSRSNSDAFVPITAELIVQQPLHSFRDASAMSVDAFNNVYVVETSSNSVTKISRSGDSLRSASGSGVEHYQFNGPVDIDARLSNAVFIADQSNHRIEQYTKELAYVSTIATRSNKDANQRFGYPRAVATDDAGNIYIADGENKRIVKARPDYSIERTIGGYSEATRPDAVVTNPVDLAVTSDENLAVLDAGGESIVQYDNLGNVLNRIPLRETANSLSASNDTLFALVPARSVVRRFHGNPLTELTSWHIQSASLLQAPVQVVALRNGAIYVLTKTELFRALVGIQ